MMIVAAIFTALLLTVLAAGVILMHRRGMDRWLGTYIRERRLRGDPEPGQPVHLLLCIADHFEPQHGGVSAQKAWERVSRWTSEYPRVFGEFRDSDGRSPRHTFFYPLELYDAGHLDALAELCRRGFGEVEVQLHHENDTAESLRQRLIDYTNLLHSRHGLLTRTSDGQIAYGFVHGNWALDNSHPAGRGCGVNNELDILRETGCYADFTFPSAPDLTQPRTINRIYYAIDDPAKPKSHDRGFAIGAGQPMNSLMLIQGPLLLDWSNRKWGLLPRIENACLQGSQPPDERRIDLWLRSRVQVPSRPDWYFVKLHTHGATETNQAVLLAEPMVQFHRAMSLRAVKDPGFHFHYVTARELYNLARAAEDRWTGSVDGARNYTLPAPPAEASSNGAGAAQRERPAHV
jgi:hypothetical protein